MADTVTANQRLLRRKHSGVDLQQTVVRLQCYKRPLNHPSGQAAASIGVDHEGGVATTANGQLYLIEKGEYLNDDINYPIRYREGASRIVQVSHVDICNWQLVRSGQEQVNPGVTLEDLFDACGSSYSFLTDNCWNGTHRMLAAANKAEDGLAWQTKAAIGVGVAAAAIGALLIGALAGGDDKDKKEKEKHKH